MSDAIAKDRARAEIERGAPWAIAKARRILAGWPYARANLAGAELTFGVEAEIVTVHRAGRRVASFDLKLMTWPDDELTTWQITHAVPKDRP